MNTPIYDELKQIADDAAVGIYHHKGLESHFGELMCNWCGKDLDPFDYKSEPCTFLSAAERLYLYSIPLAEGKGKLDSFLEYGKERYPRLFDLGEVDKALASLENRN